MSSDVTKLPPDLSPKSRRRWRTLLAQYEFAVVELDALTEALRADDRAERYDRARQGDLAAKERTASYRWMRSLKFNTSSRSSRIGRPSDIAWSSVRKIGRPGHAS
jgi:hypothetical protein